MTDRKHPGKTAILLESGTNELEIVEFSVGASICGINVAKVREIIRYPESIVPLPDSHPSCEGIANLRGRIVPIINLQRYLGLSNETGRASSYIIISEFNRTVIGFCVSSVARIHRLSWQQIESPGGLFAGEEGCIVAIVKFDERMVFLLDFEKITAEIIPESGMSADLMIEPQKPEAARSSKKVLIAEDSGYILKIIVNNLKTAGYQVYTASNGLKAWDYLHALASDANFTSIHDHVNVLITDIEMPQMDGLHLIKNIKSHDRLKTLACIVFSSLVNSEMSRKCSAVGAEAQISKPDLERLVDLVDSIALVPAGAK